MADLRNVSLKKGVSLLQRGSGLGRSGDGDERCAGLDATYGREVIYRCNENYKWQVLEHASPRARFVATGQSHRRSSSGICGLCRRVGRAARLGGSPQGVFWIALV